MNFGHYWKENFKQGAIDRMSFQVLIIMFLRLMG